MSLPFENNSQNFAGLKIQYSYVSEEQNGFYAEKVQPIPTKMGTQSAPHLKPSSPLQTERESTKKVVQAVPISFQLPENWVVTDVRMDKQLAIPQVEVTLGTQIVPRLSLSKLLEPWLVDCRQHNSGRHDMTAERGSTKNVFEPIPISFKVPEDWVINTTRIEELATPKVEERVASGIQKVRPLLLSERLKGWTVRFRERNSRRLDTYYCHEKSNRTFRSFVEVQNFIRYGIYPERREKSMKGKLKEDPLPLGYSKETIQTSSKRKWTLQRSGSRSELRKKTFGENRKEAKPQMVLEKFLDAAYNNLAESLLNFDNSGKPKEKMCEEATPKKGKEIVEENNLLKTPQESKEIVDVEENNLLNFLDEEAKAPKRKEVVDVEENNLLNFLVEEANEPKEKKLKTMEESSGLVDVGENVFLNFLDEIAKAPENKLKTMEKYLLDDLEPAPEEKKLKMLEKYLLDDLEPGPEDKKLKMLEKYLLDDLEPGPEEINLKTTGESSGEEKENTTIPSSETVLANNSDGDRTSHYPILDDVDLLWDIYCNGHNKIGNNKW